jgi:hypothetical protein
MSAESIVTSRFSPVRPADIYVSGLAKNSS